MAHDFKLTPFVAIIAETGGCDYTLDCGITVVPLKATTRDEAAVEAVEMALDLEYDERTIERVVLATGIELSLTEERARRRAAAAAEEARRREAAERAQFDRLRAKFG